LRRIAKSDVLSVRIGLTDSPIGEVKNQKVVVNLNRRGVYFTYMRSKKNPWAD